MKRREALLATLAAATLGNCAGRPPAPPAFSNGFAVKSGEGRAGKQFLMRAVTSNRMDVKISGEDTGGNLAVFEQQGQSPGGGPPLHIHPRQDEWMHIIAGDYRFRVGEATYAATAGDMIYLPRGVPHAFVQLSPAARMLVSYSPAGRMEAFFRTTSEMDGPPSPDQMKRLFAEHDMEVVGGTLEP